MSNLTLLRISILKEVRTTFRERAQLRGLIVAAIILVVAVGIGVSPSFKNVHLQPGITLATAHFGHTPEQARMMEWAAIGAAAAVSFLCSMGYLISAVLAAFVGEKEARTLEVLLASPLSDRKLYATKCVSVLLPAVGIGYLLAAIVLTLITVFTPAQVLSLPPILLFYAFVVGLPVIVLPQVFFVGVGAAISAKAETFKGASQAFNGVVMFLGFGTVYGVPLLLYHFPALQAPALAFGQKWLAMAFLTQYGSMLLVLAVPAAIALAIGRRSFRRDRMLT